MDDSALVAAIVRHDPHGLDAAYRRYADRLHAYVRSMIGDGDAAADLVHDTFVLASQHAKQLRDPGRLRPWLYAIARNQAIRHLRNRTRTRPLDTVGDLAAEPVEPAATIQRAQVVELVRAAVAGLSDGDQEIAELAIRHGISVADIASILGVSVNHAHARLSRVRTQLTVALGALLVARQRRGECGVLDEMLHGWDRRLTPLLRKRLNRHVDSCGRCAAARDERLSPAALLSGYTAAPLAPMLLLPRTADRAGAQPDQLVGHQDKLPPGSRSGIEPSGPKLPAQSGQAVPIVWDDKTGFPVKAAPDRSHPSKVMLAVAAGALAIILCGGGAVLLAGPPAAQAPLGMPNTTAGQTRLTTGAAPPAAQPTLESPTPSSTPPSDPPTSIPSSPSPPAWTVDSAAYPRCIGGGKFLFSVQTRTNTELAGAKLAYRVGLKKYPKKSMTISGGDAGISVQIPILRKVTWWVELEAADGRTLRGPTTTTPHPC